MPHHRARFTALGRRDVARNVIEEGETFARAAARTDVSTSTVWGWERRWRAATPQDQASLACLPERSDRPHCSPANGSQRRAGSALPATHHR
jgi:transposase-like protein